MRQATKGTTRGEEVEAGVADGLGQGAADVVVFQGDGGTRQDGPAQK